MKHLSGFVFFVHFCAVLGMAAQSPVCLYSDPAMPQVAFAAGEIHEAYARRGETVAELPAAGGEANACSLKIVLQVQAGPKPQAYSIRRQGQNLTVSGSDAAGAMYGGLDVAEAV